MSYPFWLFVAKPLTVLGLIALAAIVAVFINPASPEVSEEEDQKWM